MRKIQSFLFITLFIVACGGVQVEETNSEFYDEDGELLTAARNLKEKLGDINASFNEVAQLELDQSVCTEGTTLPFQPEGDELNVFLMSNYMLSNFDKEKFGANDFNMPDMTLANGTPLSDFEWLNCQSQMNFGFALYRQYPDLKDVPRRVTKEEGDSYPYIKPLEDVKVVWDALSDGLFGVVAIVDYVPPVHTEGDAFEAGYIMGYVLFADWQKGTVDCMSPFLATSSEQIDFSYTSDNEMSSMSTALNSDLMFNFDQQIKEIVRKASGFSGTIWVNDSVHMEEYR